MADFINRRDLDFLLYEVFHIHDLCQAPRYAAHDKTTFDALLDTAHRIATDLYAPHAAKLDQHEPQLVDGQVTLIPEVKRATDAFIEAGLLAASFDEDLGGLQLPYSISQAVMAMFYAANTASAAYPLLTMAAANLLAAYANDEQRERYLEPMIQGRFFGTMCLSEPQAGSSLADLRTQATPQPDGTFHIKGDKMWISAGEHDLSENIIHLVLARLPNAPAGTKGISLFIVPKFLVNPDGSLGQRNDAWVTGLNHKMGYKGTVNTVLTLGDQDQCVGYLVGQPHQGLKYMFHMMNEARIGVGLSASMLGYAGYLFSLQYAKERPQGRPITERDPNTAPIPIIQHNDVKRMLLTQKAYVEGGLALGLYCAQLVDQELIATQAQDAEALAHAQTMLAMLTPIAKAWPSEHCLEANKLAIQVLGGYGYSREYPVERLYRDNRLNAIHEGTNGIQALDLLGRKVTMHQGQALQVLASEITQTLQQAASHERLADCCASLQDALNQAAKATATLLPLAAQGQLETYLANANLYLELIGHTVVGWLWLKQAIVADTALDNTDDTAAQNFYQGKLQACRFFCRHELPKTKRYSKLLCALDDTTSATHQDWL